MRFRVESKITGNGHEVEGNFDAAIHEAMEQCNTDASRWVVWAEPGNMRMAEVSLRGALWVKSKLTGDEVRRLMRAHRKTIAALSFVMGITQERIRQVRAKGLDDRNAVRDWIEAIAGFDPGPLPERFRISRRDEETDCGDCGCPLGIGDYAYEYGMGIYCSVECARRSRGSDCVPRKVLPRDAQAGPASLLGRQPTREATTEIEPDEPGCMEQCQECGAEVCSVILCPKGREICQQCFDSGSDGETEHSVRSDQ